MIKSVIDKKKLVSFIKRIRKNKIILISNIPILEVNIRSFSVHTGYTKFTLHYKSI